MKNSIELGCGLIGIGRAWGYVETPIPSEQEVLDFLNYAFLQSIKYFDTAPSYGSSESRLGSWLKLLPKIDRENLIVATKFGEHWSEEDNKAYTDHSYDALVRSVDQSLERLGQIDVLQLHKTTPEVLRSDDLNKAWDYAQQKGISKLGASVSDLESGELVCTDDRYSIIQLPYNQLNTTFEPIIREATRKGKTVVINRPFNMGQIVSSDEKSKEQLQTKALEFIIAQAFNGYILTGTKSIKHLEENIVAFEKVK